MTEKYNYEKTYLQRDEKTEKTEKQRNRHSSHKTHKTTVSNQHVRVCSTLIKQIYKKNHENQKNSQRIATGIYKQVYLFDRYS